MTTWILVMNTFGLNSIVNCWLVLTQTHMHTHTVSSGWMLIRPILAWIRSWSINRLFILFFADHVEIDIIKLKKGVSAPIFNGDEEIPCVCVCLFLLSQKWWKLLSLSGDFAQFLKSSLILYSACLWLSRLSEKNQLRGFSCFCNRVALRVFFSGRTSSGRKPIIKWRNTKSVESPVAITTNKTQSNWV